MGKSSNEREKVIRKMNKGEQQYLDLLRDILDNGEEQDDRTGTGTLSVFGRQLRFNMQDGFPLLTTKKMFTKGIITELCWMLSGETNIKPLLEQGNKIWVGDAYKQYEKRMKKLCIRGWDTKDQFIERVLNDEEFAQKFGNLGRIYGYQWRNWDTYEEDQIKNLINDIKTNPTSRRLMVTAWNPSDLNHCILPPCHYGFQCRVSNGKLDLMWSQRSVDAPLGLGFNIASYAFLLHILAGITNLTPNNLFGSLGDCHIYKNQIDGINEQLTREPKPFPTLEFSDNINFGGSIDEFLESFTWEDFIIKGYDPYPTIKMPLSN